jgi:hypothetical protein
LATYDLAVRNEGHREYFRTYGVACAEDTRAAFDGLAGEAQSRILTEAIRRHMSAPGETGFVGIGFYRQPEYSDLDEAYRQVCGGTDTLLERYILAHANEFLQIEG